MHTKLNIEGILYQISAWAQMQNQSYAKNGQFLIFHVKVALD